MNGVTKFFLILALILFLVGITLCVVGALKGATLLNAFEDLSLKYNFNGFGGKLEEYSNTYDEDINSVEIELSYGNFKIQTADDFKIEVKSNDMSSFSDKVDSGKLIIKTESKAKILGNNQMDVTLYIPYSLNLESFKIDAGAGVIDIEKIYAKQFDANLGAGDFNIQSLTSDIANFNCGVGKTSITANINNQLSIDSGIGEVDIKLFGKYSDYNYDVQSGIGNITLGDRSLNSIQSSEMISNSSDKNVIIKGGIGKVSVKYINE